MKSASLFKIINFFRLESAYFTHFIFGMPPYWLAELIILLVLVRVDVPRIESADFSHFLVGKPPYWLGQLIILLVLVESRCP